MLFRIGHLQEVKVLPIIGEDPWHYRNKMQFPVALKWNFEIGCYVAAGAK